MEYSLNELGCIVLCGGQGTRLKSVIPDIPKPMAPLNSGMPFLHFLLDKLYRQGITHFHLATGYQSVIIEQYFESNQTPFQVTICREDQPLGTGGAIRQIAGKIKEDYLLVVNGDTFFDLNVHNFVAQALEVKKEAVLALKFLDQGKRYGQVKVTNHTITSFEEKHAFEKGFINGGIYLIQRVPFLDHTPEGSFSLEKDYFEKQVSDKCFGGIEQSGFFIDIGIPEDYYSAQTRLEHED
jgi:D-glycero-alpha-D-manno-heptose 1-phosphate guanylyltransferase